MSKDLTLNHNVSSISDPSVIAKVFNNYFSNMASNCDHNIYPSNISILNFLGAPHGKFIFLPPMLGEKIVYLIHRLKNKSTDLMNLFKNTLSERIFPECFKMAKIIPIFKSGDSNSTVYYEPISMLSFLSKMVEKLMCARLDSGIKSNNILCTYRFGFYKNSNTSDAIIEFLDYIYSSLDKKQRTNAVYINFSKSFDTVNHEILMSKLQYNVISGVMQSWFKSYLSNRKQYVSVKNSSSSMSNIENHSSMSMSARLGVGPSTFSFVHQ